MINNCNLILCLFTLLSFQVFAKKPSIGKAILVKGEVSQLPPTAKAASKLKRGDSVSPDTSILTGPKSLARIRLKNGSIVTVGPKSKMVVHNDSSRKNSVFNLLKGTIRAKVEKKKNEHFFVKTRTAALGVRGTEFMTFYNVESKRSSVLTYKGEVAFKKIKKEDFKEKVVKTTKDEVKVVKKLKVIEQLKEIIKEKAEVVKVGDFTTVGELNTKVAAPVKIDHKQFALLKKDDSLGVDDKKITKKEIKEETKKAKKLYKIEAEEGDSGKSHGGLIEAKMGFYIPPAKNKVVVGTIDNKGQYQAPKGLKVDARVGFVAQMTADKKASKKAEKLNEDLGNQRIIGRDDPNYNRYFLVE